MTSEHCVSRVSLHEPDVEPCQREYQQVENNSASPVVSEEQHGGAQSGVAGSTQSNSVTAIKPTRLPEIPLSSFYGDIYKWTSFRDRFISMVEQRTSLSNIDKFYYLVGCCKGDALESIRSIPVSDANYRLVGGTF
jgi:hypothetical protein